jgi:pimeloyl-ACP methyl ester carboxylesterase
VLVGVSLGGCVAMDYASQYPNAVGGLVLSGSTFDPCTLLCRLVLTGESVVFPRGAALFTRTLSRYLRKCYPADVAEEMIMAGTYWNAAADAVKAMRGVDFRTKLASYPGPTLILNGARDWVHRTAERSFAAAAQDARVLPLARAGHVANLDEPDAFADAVCAFANTIISR